MKLLIASDIHGIASNCQIIVDAFKKGGYDKLLLLGDIIYHGPRNGVPEKYEPVKTFELLNTIKEHIIAVRGNCDGEVDQMVLDFPILAEYTTLYYENHLIFATHGHKINESNPPHIYKGDVLLNGHFHIADCIEHDDFVYMNPGSISLPKGGTEKSYMTFVDGTFYWHTLDGNVYKEYKL